MYSDAEEEKPDAPADPPAEPEPAKPKKTPGPGGMGIGFGNDIMQQLKMKQNRLCKVNSCLFKI